MKKLFIISIFLFIVIIFLNGQEISKVKFISNVKGIEFILNKKDQFNSRTIKRMVYNSNIMELDLINSEVYKIFVNVKGYEKYEQEFLADGKDIIINLKKDFGDYYLRLSSNKRCYVFLENNKMGLTPIDLKLNKGKHRILLLSPNNEHKYIYVNLNCTQTIFVYFVNGSEIKIRRGGKMKLEKDGEFKYINK